MIKNAIYEVLLCVINNTARNIIIFLETNPPYMFNMLMSLCNSDEKENTM
ncbi:MAG: hypothetical protein ACYCT7_06930 [bacterium]